MPKFLNFLHDAKKGLTSIELSSSSGSILLALSSFCCSRSTEFCNRSFTAYEDRTGDYRYRHVIPIPNMVRSQNTLNVLSISHPPSRPWRNPVIFNIPCKKSGLLEYGNQIVAWIFFWIFFFLFFFCRGCLVFKNVETSYFHSDLNVAAMTPARLLFLLALLQRSYWYSGPIYTIPDCFSYRITSTQSDTKIARFRYHLNYTAPLLGQVNITHLPPNKW